jgi:hypothetical protein
VALYGPSRTATRTHEPFFDRADSPDEAALGRLCDPEYVQITGSLIRIEATLQPTLKAVRQAIGSLVIKSSGNADRDRRRKQRE